MRAMVFEHYGEPDVMGLRDAPVPEPQDGEILMRVGYAGVNPSDSKARSGQSARAGYRRSLLLSTSSALRSPCGRSPI